MAMKPVVKTSLFLFSFLIFLLSSSLLQAASPLHRALAGSSRRDESIWRVKERGGRGRRRMIGSVAPHCTYNECRGCRFKCRAEQVPVDAGDPMNSAYRYRCVCHR
ncbi:Epidermal patterning factor-like protein 9 [Apostasia shenzhenica]|uniref:Epidermal patterning factor-like protein 9 n=1 Tax=Apostasia shenzhenica TaxID=1088818 RepID=A0A2H9ZZA5_9ASPA|nr:Epidermal patterning factor-like protein 9 [Apostasia shenzhenica]